MECILICFLYAVKHFSARINKAAIKGLITRGINSSVQPMLLANNVPYGLTPYLRYLQ
jgi:hypothetical protein